MEENNEKKKKKKKKLKRFSPIWRPIPPEKQMYPHTHYDKDLNLQWVFEVIGILQSWDKTLTHLLVKLADLHNKDILKIVEELQKLLDIIKGWIEALTTALNAYQNAVKNFQQQAIIEAQSLVLLTQTIQSGIDALTPVMEAVLDCIETVLKRHDNYIMELVNELDDIYINIENLQEEINDLNEYLTEIFDILSKLLSNTISTSTLTYGTDYNLTWYNQFQPGSEYTNATAPRVRIQQTELKAPDKSYFSVIIKILSRSSSVVTCGATVTTGVESGPLFSHGSGYEMVPESRILKLTLLMDDLKSLNFISSSQTGTGIFNVYPKRTRATWDVNVSAGNDSPGNVMIYLGSIADGYNQQYYNRYDEDLTFGLCNFELDLNYNYSK